jgi:hypothetical protein
LFDRVAHNGAVEATRESGLFEMKRLWDLRLELENGNQSIQANTIEAYYAELQLIPEKIAAFDLQVSKAAEKILQAKIYQELFNGRRFGESDIGLCRSLTERLYEGVLIATRSNRVSGWSVDRVRKEYVPARELPKEEVNRVAHIMAAAAPCRWGWHGQEREKSVPHFVFADQLFATFAEQPCQRVCCGSYGARLIISMSSSQFQ